jgi:photosystem II stability/assembly factor-like uncharacterized protein
MIRLVFFSILLALAARAADSAPRMLLLDGTVAGRAIVVVGERGAIFRSADNALTWQAAVSRETATLTGVAFAPDGTHGWAVGHDALILTTSDAGNVRYLRSHGARAR